MIVTDVVFVGYTELVETLSGIYEAMNLAVAARERAMRAGDRAEYDRQHLAVIRHDMKAEGIRELMSNSSNIRVEFEYSSDFRCEGQVSRVFVDYPNVAGGWRVGESMRELVLYDSFRELAGAVSLL